MSTAGNKDTVLEHEEPKRSFMPRQIPPRSANHQSHRELLARTLSDVSDASDREQAPMDAVDLAGDLGVRSRLSWADCTRYLKD